MDKKGASLPQKLQTLLPILDLSKPDKNSETRLITGHIVKSFPLAWEGTWKGTVVVKKKENIEMSWLGQPASTYRSCQFFKPGSRLSLLLRFNRDGDRLSLSAPVASGTFKHAQDLIKAILVKTGEQASYPGSNPLLRLGVSDELDDSTLPVQRAESFSFGKRYGPSAGGNFVESEILSNELHELAPGVIEQDLVTSSTSQSLYGSGSPAPSSSFGESVVRLSRQDDKLQLTLAYVYYQKDGFCVGKCVLEGILERIGD